MSKRVLSCNITIDKISCVRDRSLFVKTREESFYNSVMILSYICDTNGINNDIKQIIFEKQIGEWYIDFLLRNRMRNTECSPSKIRKIQ